jgi:type I restriction enzyme S subunit
MRLVKRPFSCIQNIFPKVGIDGKADTVWFYYAMQGRVSISEYKGHHPLFREAFVPTPSVDVQRRIASILSAYDDLIENNTRRIAILEEMARRIYEEWFVRFRFPGHDNVRIVESELGPVPEGWQIAPLGDLIEDVRDTVSPDSLAPDTPYVGLEHIPRRSIALAEWGHAANAQSTKVRFRERDILFAKIRPYFHKVAIAPLAGVASSDAIVIRPKRDEIYGLVLAVVSSDAFIAEATQTSNGTKMPRANWSVLRRYPVPIAPAALRARFEELMVGIVSAVGNHVLRSRNLRATRDLLLPKLISGELDVSALPVAETVAA